MLAYWGLLATISPCSSICRIYRLKREPTSAFRWCYPNLYYQCLKSVGLKLDGKSPGAWLSTTQKGSQSTKWALVIPGWGILSSRSLGKASPLYSGVVFKNFMAKQFETILPAADVIWKEMFILDDDIFG